MAILNGFTPDTAKNMQLNAGILVKNLTDIESFTGTIVDGNKIGATEGGANFTAIPEIRNIFEGIDGARGNYKDGNVIDSWEIKLTGTMKEMTAENFKLALGSADIVEPQEGGKFTKITGRTEIKSEDYLNNICWLGTVNGSESPMIIEIKNAMNVTGLNFTAEDKGSGSVEFEIQGHFDISKPDEVPFTIYTPKKTVK